MSERKLNQSGEFDKPTWDWTTVECILKTTENNRKSVQWQLAPSILLTNPTSTNSDPNVRLFIDTEKSLSYAPDLGWNWHKSWNLPNISIRLEIKDEVTGQQLLTPKNIYAQIFAVKKNGDNERSDKVTLLDVGIRGDSKLELIDGQAFFNAMKFSSTTYNNEGQNFHLLIVIYIQENENDKPKVLTAVISPEIFVDSRRSARDYQQKKFNSFVEPFSIDQLQKQFIKRENKSRTEQQVEIKNDPEGFYNYLTAPNIRHKVKHPIFLGIRFSNCVNIMYNHDRLTELYNPEKEGAKITAREIIEMLQKKLLKESQTKSVRQDQVLTNIPEKLYLFVVKNVTDSLKRKKVLQSIETLQSQSFGVVEDDKELPLQFKNFSELGSLSKIYKDNYQLLRDLCRRFVPSDEESSNQYSDEEFGRQEEVKRVKVSKLQAGNQVAFTANPAKKNKSSNLIFQTIQTPDQTSGNNQVKTQQEVKIEKRPSDEPSLFGKNQQRAIKKEEVQKQMTFTNQHGFAPLTSNTPNYQNTNATSSFTLNIGSKKPSAFNNLRPSETEKPNPVFPSAPAQTPQPAQSALQQPQQYPASSIAYTGFSQNPNVSGFNMGALGGMGAFGNMGRMSGMTGMNNMAGLTGMGNLQGMAGMAGMTGMGGIPAINGMQLGGMGNMGALSGLQAFPNMQGMLGNPLAGMMGNSFSNYPTGNNHQNMNGMQQSINQNMVNLSNMTNMTNPPKSLQNLFCSNLLLSNWLNSVKANNMNLEQTMKNSGSISKEDEEQKKLLQAKNSNDPLLNMNRMPSQGQEQQSMIGIIQQITLYRQLLAQITYQNQLLSRNMGSNGSSNGSNQMQDAMPNDRGMVFRGFVPGKENESREAKEEHQQ